MTTGETIIVTPFYEDLESLRCLLKELDEIFGKKVFVIVVDDGSITHPTEASDLEASGAEGLVIKLRRNLGHQQAIAVGLNYVADNFLDVSTVVVMDSDGEDRPESISQLRQALQERDVEIAVAERKSRVESVKFRMFYKFYKLIFSLLAGRKINFGNFMAMTGPALRRLTSMQDLWIHLAGCVLNSKLRIVKIPIDRGPRYAGQSKMNFVGLLLHGFRGLMVFSENVLVRVGIACASVAALSVVGAFTAIILKIIGFATPGWFSVAFGVLVLVFLQTGAITLMTLMLTGAVRGGSMSKVNYLELVEKVDPTS